MLYNPLDVNPRLLRVLSLFPDDGVVKHLVSLHVELALHAHFFTHFGSLKLGLGEHGDDERMQG